MRKYKAVFVGNRPLILSNLSQHQRIELVHAFVMSDSLIQGGDFADIRKTICTSNDKSLVLEFLRSGDYDICVSAGCPYILPISTLPSGKVFVNTHPSMLPYGKGIHPINECFLSEHKRAGVSIHYLTDELDAGDIIDQVAFDVTDDLDTDLLYSFIFSLEGEVFKRSIDRIIENELSYCGRPQAGFGSYYSRNDSDLMADIQNIGLVAFLEKVRAFSSRSLGVRIRLNGIDMTVHRAFSVKNEFVLNRFSSAPAGSLLISNDNFLLVRLIDGIVRIDKWFTSV